MKFTREQVIEMAKATDLAEARDDASTLPAAYVQALDQLCTIAADTALEAAAVECEKYDSLRIDGAGETIRDLKDKP